MISRALVLLLACSGGAWAAKPVPAPPRSYVYNEGVVSPAAAERLSRSLSSLEQRSGHQFVLALFDSIDNESVDDFTNRVFRAWKVGDAKRNDGLLFALYRRDRRWRVETGYGLEHVVTDLEAAQISRDFGVPYFRRGDFDGGVEAVTAALAAKLAGEPGPKPPANRTPRVPPPSDPTLGLYLLWFVIVIVFLLLQRISRRYGFRGGSGSGWGGGDWGGGGGFSSGGGDSGGFSGGGGSSGGGGASGDW